MAVVPDDRAERRRTRFDRLFEPGRSIVPEKRVMGFNVRDSMVGEAVILTT